MITSELVSNSIKYAFKNTSQPCVTIQLKRAGNTGKMEYSVCDNGCGLIQTDDTREKLGMRLVGIFSRQLKGEYKFENQNGLKYSVKFNK